MVTTVAEVTWLTSMFKELGVEIEKPITFFCDSKAAIQIASHPIFHKRTKHIDIDCHFLREKVQEKLIQTQHIGTRKQLEDFLNKSLCKTQHDYLINKLGMKNLFSSTRLRRSVEESEVLGVVT